MINLQVTQKAPMIIARAINNRVTRAGTGSPGINRSNMQSPVPKNSNPCVFFLPSLSTMNMLNSSPGNSAALVMKTSIAILVHTQCMEAFANQNMS